MCPRNQKNTIGVSRISLVGEKVTCGSRLSELEGGAQGRQPFPTGGLAVIQ